MFSFFCLVLSNKWANILTHWVHLVRVQEASKKKERAGKLKDWFVFNHIECSSESREPHHHPDGEIQNPASARISGLFQMGVSLLCFEEKLLILRSSHHAVNAALILIHLKNTYSLKELLINGKSDSLISSYDCFSSNHKWAVGLLFHFQMYCCLWTRK